MTQREKITFFLKYNDISMFDVDMISKRNRSIRAILSQAKWVAKTTGRFSMMHECRTNVNKNQYPDVTITNAKEVLLQCELKHREARASVISQINGMTNYIAKEFWFLLDRQYNIAYIKTQVDNKAVRIMYIDQFLDSFTQYVNGTYN